MRTHRAPGSSPLRVSLFDLDARPGATVSRTVRWAAPADLGTPVMGVEPGAPLDVQVDLTSVEDGVLVHAEVEVDLRGECVRCLRPVRERASVEADEMFVEPDAVRDEEEAQDAEVFEIDRDAVDLEGMLRDAIVTRIPYRPICGPDCPGRPPGAPEPEPEARIDPRLADLEKFFHPKGEQHDI